VEAGSVLGHGYAQAIDRLIEHGAVTNIEPAAALFAEQRGGLRVEGVDLELAVSWNIGGQPVDGSDHLLPLLRPKLFVVRQIAKPDDVDDRRRQHARRCVDENQDVPATHAHAGQVLSIALRNDRSRLARVFLGDLSRRRLLDAFEFGEPFLSCLQVGLCVQVEVQFAFGGEDVLAEPVLDSTCHRSLVGDLGEIGPQLSEHALTGHRQALQAQAVRLETFEFLAGVFLDFRADDHEDEDHRSKPAADAVEKRERKCVDRSTGHRFSPRSAELLQRSRRL